VSSLRTRIFLVSFVYGGSNRGCSHQDCIFYCLFFVIISWKVGRTALCQEYAPPALNRYLLWERKCLVVVEYRRVVTGCKLLFYRKSFVGCKILFYISKAESLDGHFIRLKISLAKWIKTIHRIKVYIELKVELFR
jgi:hypothetical protein